MTLLMLGLVACFVVFASVLTGVTVGGWAGVLVGLGIVGVAVMGAAVCTVSSWGGAA